MFLEMNSLKILAGNNLTWILGGDSLSAFRIISQCKEHGVIISPQDLFGLGVLYKIAEAAIVSDISHSSQVLFTYVHIRPQNFLRIFFLGMKWRVS